MSASEPDKPVTALLLAWREGNADAGRELVGCLQRELRRIARQYMSRERGNHTLQPTALVNELFLRLIGAEKVAWQNRAHFLAVASQQLRRILVDHAREHLAGKRGGSQVRVTLVDGAAATPPLEERILDLHRALEELVQLDARAAHVVELRYLGGLSEKETAEVLSISVATVKRDWNVGRAWLLSRLKSHID